MEGQINSPVVSQGLTPSDEVSMASASEGFSPQVAGGGEPPRPSAGSAGPLLDGVPRKPAQPAPSMASTRDLHEAVPATISPGLGAVGPGYSLGMGPLPHGLPFPAYVTPNINPDAPFGMGNSLVGQQELTKGVTQRAKTQVGQQQTGDGAG